MENISIFFECEFQKFVDKVFLLKELPIINLSKSNLQNNAKKTRFEKIATSILNILKLNKNKKEKNSKIIKKEIKNENKYKIQEINEFSSFYSEKQPRLSIGAYFKRINKIMQLTENEILLSLYYMRKILQISNFKKEILCFHKLLFTSIIIAKKYLDDESYNDSDYCIIGGINVESLMEMQLEFLQKIDYKLYVSENELKKIQLSLFILKN